MTAKQEYKLTVPPGTRCFIPDCDLPPTRVLNLRIRRIDTGASYGPNIDGAWLCTRHGDSGADIVLDYAPRTDGTVHTTVTHDNGLVTETRRPIGDTHPNQMSLA